MGSGRSGGLRRCRAGIGQGINASCLPLHILLENWRSGLPDSDYDVTGPGDRRIIDCRDSGFPKEDEKQGWSIAWATDLFISCMLLSRGAVYLLSADVDVDMLRTRNIYLGGGFADFDLLKRTYDLKGMSSVLGLAWTLDDLGIDYNGKGSVRIVPGSHDWFTWPQLAYDYLSDYLWK